MPYFFISLALYMKSFSSIVNLKGSLKSSSKVFGMRWGCLQFWGVTEKLKVLLELKGLLGNMQIFIGY